MEKELKEIFKESISEANKVCPPYTFEKFLMFFNGNIIYKPKNSQAIKDYKRLKGKIKDKFSADNLAQLTSYKNVVSNKKLFDLIYFPKLLKGLRPEFSKAVNNYDFMLNVSVFDHEMGHLLIGKEEAKAETYAALMHVKRFGNQTGFLEHSAFEMSAHATCNKVSQIVQFSSNCWLAVAALSKRIDINKLSLKDIREYSALIPEKFEFSEKELEKANDLYIFTRDDEDKLITDRVIDVMHKNIDCDEIYRVGKLVLSQPHIREKLGVKFEFIDINDKSRGFILNPVEALDKKTGKDSIGELIDEKRNFLNKKMTKKLASCIV